MYHYVLIEYPTFMFFEGPFTSQEKAEQHSSTAQVERPSAVRHTIVRTCAHSLVGGVIEFVPVQESVVS